ncbi:hypothetical protein [Streptomyces sp. NPDC058701]|uniref:hypothetical protein n=1 Tax=Streptomyces sp. NPDC058701 TaxID=3346608 RepID=UPI00364C73FD
MTDDHTPLGGASEEQALRGLLHGAVGGLEPSEGALERLRYAVPARRTRRRRAVVGAAAAALLAGAGIPAAVHLSGGGSTAADRSAMAGHGERAGATGGTGSPEPRRNGAGTHPRATVPAGAPDAGGTTGEPDRAAAGAPTGGTGASAGPSGAGTPSGSSLGQDGQVPATGPRPPAAQGVARCGADQLGVVASSRAPGADGKVYGSFKVTNVSVRGCVVSGPDTVTAAAAEPGTGTGTAVVGHTAGDPASGLLPDPSSEPPLLVLQPNTAYEVRFAWVPSGEPCPATTPAGPKPPQGDSGDAAGGSPGGADGTGGAAAGTDSQTVPPPPDPAGVAVAHTPATGSPTTQTTIPEACGGTLYRTGSIPLDAPAP